MNEHIELTMAYRPQSMEGYVAHRLSMLESDARRAEHNGKRSLRVPLDWLESIAADIGSYLPNFNDANKVAEQWNNLREDVYSLDTEYAPVPILLDIGADLCASILDNTETTDDDVLDIEKVTCMANMLSYAREEFVSLETGSVLFGDDGELIVSGCEQRDPAIYEAYVEPDEELLNRFAAFNNNLSQLAVSGTMDVNLPLEIITEILCPIRDAPIPFVNETDTTMQIDDFVMGIMQYENDVEGYISLLREAAQTIRPFASDEMLANAYGLDHQTLVLWLGLVDKLIGPIEQRTRQPEPSKSSVKNALNASVK